MKDIDLIFLDIPYVVDGRYETTGFLEKVAKDHGLRYFSIAERLSDKNPEISKLTLDGAHFTRYGNIIVADIIKDIILNETQIIK